MLALKFIPLSIAVHATGAARATRRAFEVRASPCLGYPRSTKCIVLEACPDEKDAISLWLWARTSSAVWLADARYAPSPVGLILFGVSSGVAAKFLARSEYVGVFMVP